MAQLKGQAIDGFVAAPDPRTPIILVYGSDRGRIMERTDALARTLAGSDAMARIDLDPQRLAEEPSLLAEEADSVSMFGGRKVVIAKLDDPKPLAGVLERLLDTPSPDTTVILVAGNLSKTHPVRTRMEKAATGMALPCYVAEADDLNALLTAELQRSQLTMGREARDLATSLLGADHALSRAEIEKLCLLARGDGEVTVDHVAASLAGSAETSLQDTADHAFAGDRSGALRALDVALREGTDASVIGQTLLRHAQLLERMRIDMDRGSTVETALQRARPPVFFKRKPRVLQALKRWPAARLRACAGHLDAELVEARLDRALAAVRVERMVLRVASMATQRR